MDIEQVHITPDPYEPLRVSLRDAWFTPPYPADTIVEVRSLYSPDAMIEIEAIAVADQAAHWVV